MEPYSPQIDHPNDERNILAQERTQLAAERTFLSWIRTGLTSIGIGIALARFIIFQQSEHQRLGHIIGQLLILWGVAIFVIALVSYRRTASQLKAAPYKRGSFVGLTLATIILIILTLALFWIVVE